MSLDPTDKYPRRDLPTADSESWGRTIENDQVLLKKAVGANGQSIQATNRNLAASLANISEQLNAISTQQSELSSAQADIVAAQADIVAAQTRISETNAVEVRNTTVLAVQPVPYVTFPAPSWANRAIVSGTAYAVSGSISGGTMDLEIMANSAPGGGANYPLSQYVVDGSGIDQVGVGSRPLVINVNPTYDAMYFWLRTFASDPLSGTMNVQYLFSVTWVE